MADMTIKSREEYLIEFEKKLLQALTDLYKSVNQNFIIIYVISILVTLISWDLLSELSLSGAKIILNKSSILLYMPIVISIIYVLIDHQLIRIASVYRAINVNALEISAINPQAKPISVDNIYLFSSGIIELLLALTRLTIHRLLTNNPFKYKIRESADDNVIVVILRMLRLTYETTKWASRAVVRFIVIGIIFFLPGILIGYYEYMEFFYHKTLTYGFNLPSLFILILALAAISTTICGLILALSYLADIVEVLKNDIERLANEFNESSEEIIALFNAIRNVLTSLPYPFNVLH